VTGPVRFRVKGTALYVAPMARADAGVYPTTGTGPRSRWGGSSLGPNAALDYSAVTLRNQSRDLIRKNALASAALERVVSNTIGTGIRPKIEDEALAALWNRWTDESAADGMLDFYGQQQQVMASTFTAGECFGRKRNRMPVDGLSVPLQIEVLAPEFVPHELNRMEGLNEIRQGIEFDANLKSKRVAYWVYPKHPGDGGTTTSDNQPVRIPASEIIHVYDPMRNPGQIRGEPWMARVLDVLKDVESYTKAELIRKKTVAMYVGFVSRPTPQGMSLDELKEFYGNGGEDGADSATAIANGAGSATLEPGTMQFLEPGEEVKFAEPSDVGGQYEVFLRQEYRKIAAALGLLYEQLTGDYGDVNDRTWRAAVSEFRRRCEAWQHHLMVFQFCRPIWQRWCDLAVLSRAAPRGLDGRAPIEWNPPRWPYINPVQDIQALEAEIKAGLDSRTAIVSKHTGKDAAVVDREQAADNARSDDLGLKYTSDGRNAVKAVTPGAAGQDPNADPQGQQPGNDNQAVKAVAQMAREMTATMSEAFKGLAVSAKPQAPSVGIVLDEKHINIDMVRAEDVTVESWDEQNRIKTMIARPVSGKGKAKRRTAKHDPATGRAIGWTEEVIEENTDV
jgi:lambda family phage portal protein